MTRNISGMSRVWMIWLVVGLAVSFVVGASFIQEMHRRVLVQQQINELRKEIHNREQRIVQLQKLTEYLKTDAYLERAAREKLGYQRPGEQVVVVPRSEESPQEIIESRIEQTEQRRSIPQQWWDLYFTPHSP